MSALPPMPVASRLAPHFALSIREYGYDYFRRKLVRIKRGTASELYAEVRGGQKYEVILTWTNGKVALFCGCLYFTDRGEPCKHLWAAILAADADGYLGDLAATASVPPLDLDSFRTEQGEQDQAAMGPLRVLHASLRTPPPKSWKKQLEYLFESMQTDRLICNAWPSDAEVLYVIDPIRSDSNREFSLWLYFREPRKSGGWKIARPLSLDRGTIEGIRDAEDREILSVLVGARKGYECAGASELLSLSPLQAGLLVPRMVRTNRCYLASSLPELRDHTPLRWDEGEAWRLILKLREAPPTGWKLYGRLQRGEEQMELTTPLCASASGFLVMRETVARLDLSTSIRWFKVLKRARSIIIPRTDEEEVLASLLSFADLPALDLPLGLQIDVADVAPKPFLNITGETHSDDSDTMIAHLAFVYGDCAIAHYSSERGIFDGSARRFHRRDRSAETAAAEFLKAQGARPILASWQTRPCWGIDQMNFLPLVSSLLAAGWMVIAEGRTIRRPERMTARVVRSGIDWFDLCGEVQYGEVSAQLPGLLSALHRGEARIALEDGSSGLLPEDWLRQFRVIASMGLPASDRIRFSRSQASLLDALLADQPEISCDPAFSHVRQELNHFERIEPAVQPVGFAGVLRDYQRVGLGWMHFLRQLSFGGCLADDMGVGKTAQVLALLETRRELRAQGMIDRPSLVVVPRSLMFNWKQEAARFTPQIRILDHTGKGRNANRFADVDLILTTYGTLRRDEAHFKEIIFDYVVLDEAQAIKGAQTELAGAVRSLRGLHRLALSGTPIENDLGELWSLFEFLNPGLLGGSSVSQLGSGALRNPDQHTRQLLARALRPFFLRRTKAQVARELPPKVEQTIFCELGPRQRSLYNELRKYYRESLLHSMREDVLSKGRIQILEALLRLRQAACHPGLINSQFLKHSGAKLDLLHEQLGEVLREGHKALVFSQFTGLLDIVRQRLDADHVAYAYLDGKTKDRQLSVETFQNDPRCGVFLISLKAGGVGLNLTAADYVFILDPWWNPAVEAQAVDRTHRVGQHKQVFAYRLIARDTVEERVLALQDAKRNLADAILGNGSRLICDLRREDLELLLS